MEGIIVVAKVFLVIITALISIGAITGVIMTIIFLLGKLANMLDIKL